MHVGRSWGKKLGVERGPQEIFLHLLGGGDEIRELKIYNANL
jgi:hypothetical protein